MDTAVTRDVHVLQFGNYELSRAERLLLRDGRVVALQARPFDLLLYLIDHSNRVVSRDELLRTVWKGVSVNEQALRFAVHALRKAIGDSGHAQRVIRTVRGTGLQFIAPLKTSMRPITSASSRLGPRVDHSFLGRESFMRSVEQSLNEVTSGRARALLATGEAGIGKTTALLRAATLASERGFRIGFSRCVGTDEAPALWPWTQVLRRLVEGESRSWLEHTMRDGAEAIGWVLPELQDLIPGALITPRSDARASRYRLFDGIYLLLMRLSKQSPVAVLIDDLHEADPASLLLLEHLAAELTGSRAFLFATFRTHGDEYQKCAQTVSSVLRVHGSELVTLAGLREPEVAIIAESWSGAEPSAAAVRSIIEKTNGNPFFILQVLRVLESDGCLETLAWNKPLEYSLPRGIRDAIRKQIDLLPTNVKNLLAMASVIDKEFSTPLLKRALCISSAEVLECLELAMGAGVCITDDEGSSYRFTHALVRDAIHASLTIAERAENNGRIASAMEETSGPDFGPLCAEIARHFAAAYPSPVAERAIRFLMLAARWDIERAAFDSAVLHLDRAADLLDRVRPDDVETRCELYLERGAAHGYAANRELARAFLLDAYRLAERCERPDLAGRAALSFAPDLLAIETGVYDEELVALLEGSLRMLRDDAEERPRILARLAVALHWSDESRARIKTLLEEATVCAQRLENAELVSFIRTAGSLALYSVESPNESVQESRSTSSEDLPTALLRTILRITSLWQVGRIKDVDIEIGAFTSLIHRTRRPSAAWYSGMLRATRALMKGEYGLARELGEEYLRQGIAADDRNALHSFALQRAMAAIDIGGLDEIEPAVVEMSSLFPRVEGWRAGVAYLYTELGKLADAREILESLIGQGILRSFPRNSWFGTLGSITLACRNIEMPETVRELYARWLPFSGQVAVVGFSSFCWGSTDRFLGVAAGLLGDRANAQLHFERAIIANRAAGAGPALAQTYADQAAMLEREKLGSGRACWDLALQQARTLGMKNLEQRVLREGF